MLTSLGLTAETKRSSVMYFARGPEGSPGKTSMVRRFFLG
jgi:hypothetical protein